MDIRVAAEQARVALPRLLHACRTVAGISGATNAGRAALASLEAALQAQPSPVEAQAVPDQPVAIKNLNDHLECLVAVLEDRSRPKDERHYQDGALDIQTRYAR